MRLDNPGAGNDTTQVMAALEALSENEEELLAFEEKMNTEGKAALGPEGFEIMKGMCSWVKGSKKISEIKFTPSVIEPSFGERKGQTCL